MTALRILITGGAGFIGANLVATLRTSYPSVEVAVIDDFSTGRREALIPHDVDVFEGSILDLDMLARAALGADSIVHLAARPSVPRSISDPRASHEANATGTLNVLEIARQASSHVTVASSSSVYGANPALPKSEHMLPMPMSPYGASKLATESYTNAWSRAYGLPALAFRFFNVYGPGQRAGHAYAAVIPAFLSQVIHGQPIQVHGDGSQTRDFTHVSTVCDLLARASTTHVTNPSPVNLALGTRTSLNELISVIARVTSHDPSVEYGAARAGDVPHSCADATLLTSLFSDVPVVKLEDGVRSTYEWLRSQG